MPVRSISIALVALLFLLQPCPAQSQQKSWLDRLYKWIWPAGRYKGDLGSASSVNTQKAGATGGVARIYIVDIGNKKIEAWPTGYGAVNPVVSPEGKELFYLRGNDIFFESISVAEKSVVATSDPKKLIGINAKALYACTRDEQGRLALWATSMQGRPGLVLLDLPNAKGTWAALPKNGELASLDPDELVDRLQKLRSLRPDGFQALVRSWMLFIKQGDSASEELHIESDVQVFGPPVWASDNSSFLFINGLANR